MQTIPNKVYIHLKKVWIFSATQVESESIDSISDTDAQLTGEWIYLAGRDITAVLHGSELV